MTKQWPNPSGFGSRPSSFRRRSRVIEKIAFWSFRLATYVIIAATSYIFLDIA